MKRRVGVGRLIDPFRLCPVAIGTNRCSYRFGQFGPGTVHVNKLMSPHPLSASVAVPYRPNQGHNGHAAHHKDGSPEPTPNGRPPGLDIHFDAGSALHRQRAHHDVEPTVARDDFVRYPQASRQRVELDTKGVLYRLANNRFIFPQSDGKEALLAVVLRVHVTGLLRGHGVGGFHNGNQLYNTAWLHTRAWRLTSQRQPFAAHGRLLAARTERSGRADAREPPAHT